MENNSKSRLSLFIILILIIVVLIYLFGLTDRGSEPVEVLSPEGYAEGTTLALYEKAPPTFPAGIILENIKLDHSSVLTLPDGKTQTKVAYTSEKSVMDLAYKTKGFWVLQVIHRGTLALTFGFIVGII